MVLPACAAAMPMESLFFLSFFVSVTASSPVQEPLRTNMGWNNCGVVCEQQQSSCVPTSRAAVRRSDFLLPPWRRMVGGEASHLQSLSDDRIWGRENEKAYSSSSVCWYDFH